MEKDKKFLCDECMNYVNDGEDLCDKCKSKKELYEYDKYKRITMYERISKNFYSSYK